MERYERFLVCIDSSDRCPNLIQYAGGRSRAAVSKEAHFLYISDDPAGMPDDALRSLVTEHFNGHGGEEVFCEVIRGAPLIEVLRYAHEKDIDLIMMERHFGRRSESDDDATLARRVTRKATCSVLVLPEEYEPKADAIIVPVRDSECSKNALEVACGIAAKTGASVTALNVYAVRAGYSRVGTTLDQHQALLEAAASKECDELMKRTEMHGVTVESQCAPDFNGHPVRVILDVLGNGKGKAVVIGGRGRTGAAGVLLGTVTEQLIRKSPAPVLGVKKKGECVGLLRAMLIIAGPEE